jgi:hypothetical protein
VEVYLKTLKGRIRYVHGIFVCRQLWCSWGKRAKMGARGAEARNDVLLVAAAIMPTAGEMEYDTGQQG